MSESGMTPPPDANRWEALAREASRGLAGVVEEAADLEREFLVFGLDASAYAVPIERVREIVRMRSLTRVPRAPAWLLGVVALRGEVVEVIDLRRRLGIGASSPDRAHRIIVLHGDIDRVTGLLVDSVSEVLRVPESEMQPAQGLDVSRVSEVCARGDDFVSVLDVDRVLGGQADG